MENGMEGGREDDGGRVLESGRREREKGKWRMWRK